MPEIDTPESTSSASRVHRLAIPRHVTMCAERRPDAIGGGHHYAITGYYPMGEQAFAEQVVSGDAARDPAEAIRVQLGRFREKGW